jgi:hypothetical protein
VKSIVASIHDLLVLAISPNLASRTVSVAFRLTRRRLTSELERATMKLTEEVRHYVNMNTELAAVCQDIGHEAPDIAPIIRIVM